MNDIRKLLESVDKLNESQNHDFLNTIVDKYAKPGMKFSDIANLEKEAIAAKPPEGGFLSGLTNKLLTNDFKKKYVLAHASSKLGLPGLYDSQGRYLHYLDDSGEPATAGNANKQEAIKINDAGLLPPSVATSFKLDNKSGAPGVPVDDETSLSPGNQRASTWKNPNVKDGNAAGAPSRWQTQLNKTGVDSSSITLRSTNKTYSYSNQADIRTVSKEYGKLIVRYQKLMKKMNESAPISLRGYLKEYAIQDLLLEALTVAEQNELKVIYQDLMTIANWTIKDSSGKRVPVIGEFNVRDIRDKLKNAPSFVRDSTPKATADWNKDSGMNLDSPEDVGSGTPGKFSSGFSRSLADFAKSGKKGLSNDPDEIPAIKELQGFLNEIGLPIGKVDGVYGPNTMNAVKKLQELTGAKVDGDVGPETIADIIMLKNLKWGKNGDLTSTHLMSYMDEIEDLIGKTGGAQTFPAGANPAGAPDSAMFKSPSADDMKNDQKFQSQLQDLGFEESRDFSFRGLINLVENMLTEGLSAREKERLQQLIADLQTLKNNPNAPKGIKSKVDTLIARANDALKAPEAEPEEPKDAVGAVKSIGDQLIKAFSGAGTVEDMVWNALEKLQTQQEFDALIKQYPEVGEVLRGQDETSPLLGPMGMNELTYSEREKVNKILQRKGIDLWKGSKEEPKKDTGLGPKDANMPDQLKFAEPVTAREPTPDEMKDPKFKSMLKDLELESVEDARDVVAEFAGKEAEAMKALSPEYQEKFKRALGK